MALSESLRKQISDLLATNRAVLFMKGTPRNPQCGFSAQVVQILDELPPSYETVNVLSARRLRARTLQASTALSADVRD